MIFLPANSIPNADSGDAQHATFSRASRASRVFSKFIHADCILSSSMLRATLCQYLLCTSDAGIEATFCFSRLLKRFWQFISRRHRPQQPHQKMMNDERRNDKLKDNRFCFSVHRFIVHRFSPSRNRAGGTPFRGARLRGLLPPRRVQKVQRGRKAHRRRVATPTRRARPARGA